MDSRVQIVSIVALAGLFAIVFELVRRRRLMERYALGWLFGSAVLLGLAVWRDLLERFAEAIGIFYAPSALFAIALGVILLLLLHFSLVVSALTDQNKVLAQRIGLLQQQIDELRSPPPFLEAAPDRPRVLGGGAEPRTVSAGSRAYEHQR